MAKKKETSRNSSGDKPSVLPHEDSSDFKDKTPVTRSGRGRSQKKKEAELEKRWSWQKDDGFMNPCSFYGRLQRSMEELNYKDCFYMTGLIGLTWVFSAVVIYITMFWKHSSD